jgi:thiol-disulfide isomerase/thioredoxin
MTPSRRDALILGAAAVAAAGAGFIAGALVLQSRSAASALLSTTYPDLAGRTRRLLEWRGRLLLCNFWATWCAPCREEMPMLSRMREKYEPKGVEFVGISIDSAAKVLEFSKKMAVSYPLLIGDAGAIDLMRTLGNPSGALPFTIVLDRAGAVAYRRLGALTQQELEQALVGFLR